MREGGKRFRILERVVTPAKRMLDGIRLEASLNSIASESRRGRGAMDRFKTVAMNWRPKSEAWGGGNQFAMAIGRYLAKRGHKVTFDLRHEPDAILLVEGVEPTRATFFTNDVERYLRSNPGVVVAHRVNECDRRKGTGHVDARLRQTNATANRTVFISRWLKEYHGWNSADQHVIWNGCDEEIFFPGAEWDGTPPFRLVTHHWSPNWNKGFRFYQEIDRAIATGYLKDFTLTVIGSWPQDCKWKAARLVGSLWGKTLADELRNHHGYITASLWEPCGMHHVEAAACGLPVAYHENGGGIPEMCSRYGVEFSDDSVEAARILRYRYAVIRQKLVQFVPSLSATKMCSNYAKILDCE